MAGEREAFMPPEMVRRVLEAAAQDVVLVGGQALAFWMDHYGVSQGPSGDPAVSRDVDFFTREATNSRPLFAFARAIGGRAEVQEVEAITALIGSAIAPAGGELIYNVDLLHSVIGLDRTHIEANAVVATLPWLDATVRVMHPLDVLQSRNANLHVLKAKQDEAGRRQLQLAIEVGRAYLEEQIDAIERNAALSEHDRERAIFDVIGAVDQYSAEDAGRKNAARYGIFLADAIPAWRISSPVFWSKQWQFLRARMSPEYARSCEARRK